MEISESKYLTDAERFICFSLINLFELVFGYLFGMITNEVTYLILPHTKNEGMITTIISFFIFGTLIINGTLYIRRFVRTLPILDVLSKKADFSHPPPIALTFGFWMTQNQLKSRSDSIQNLFFKFINSPTNLPK